MDSLTANTLYKFKVTAVNAAAKESDSAELDVTTADTPTPDAPESLVAEHVGHEDVIACGGDAQP